MVFDDGIAGDEHGAPRQYARVIQGQYVYVIEYRDKMCVRIGTIYVSLGTICVSYRDNMCVSYRDNMCVSYRSNMCVV